MQRKPWTKVTAVSQSGDKAIWRYSDGVNDLCLSRNAETLALVAEYRELRLIVVFRASASEIRVNLGRIREIINYAIIYTLRDYTFISRKIVRVTHESIQVKNRSSYLQDLRQIKSEGLYESHD